jgi:chemotaxis protein methyltransferase CheR
MKSLGISDVLTYRSYLESHGDEWKQLDQLCRIPISRFYRDHAVFRYLEQTLLPQLAEAAQLEGAAAVRAWSAGCGAGEEPYTLNLLWRFSMQQRFPQIALRILATDIDPQQLDRAITACYSRGSVKDLPKDWLDVAFEADRNGNRYILRPEFREGIEFRSHDLRREPPDGPFDLILCRNVAFTYFDEDLQHQVAARFHERLVPGGALVLGIHEVLPADVAGFVKMDPRLRVYRRDIRVV